MDARRLGLRHGMDLLEVMITPPTAPSPGKPVSAGFFSSLIAWVKSGMLVEGPGYRLKRTQNGTALDICVRTGNKSSALPWSFSCIEDEISGERTGGWSNCILQLGYNKFLHSPDVKHVTSYSGSSSISGS